MAQELHSVTFDNKQIKAIVDALFDAYNLLSQEYESTLSDLLREDYERVMKQIADSIELIAKTRSKNENIKVKKTAKRSK